VNIAVCVKQVPDVSEVRIDPATNTLARQGVPSALNPFDRHAVEEAVRLRERLGAGTVTAISMGPPQAGEVLREAISLGADDAVLLSSRALAGADTLATSLALALAARKLAASLILAGRQAVDADTGQVGPEMASWLGWAQVCYVARIREIGGGTAIVERVLDSGREVLEVELPAVFTVVREINDPRVPSLKGRMRAKKAVIPVWSEKDIGAEASAVGLAGSPTSVAGVFAPPGRSGGEMIAAGNAAEAGRLLANRLRQTGLA
jgi:electron transfer flavoprotein beta subunit